jgi:hypothetical protein
MALKSYQFDRETVSPLADAKLYEYLIHGVTSVIPGLGNNLSVSISGLTATIDTGAALICGRVVEVITPHAVAIPANASGYLVLTVDLSKANSSTGDVGAPDYAVVNNQVRAEFVTSLTTQDLNNAGTLHTLNLGTVSSNASTASYTKNQAAYPADRAIIAPSGVIAGANGAEWDSKLLGNTWSSRTGDLLIRPKDGKKAIFTANDGSQGRVLLEAAGITNGVGHVDIVPGMALKFEEAGQLAEAFKIYIDQTNAAGATNINYVHFHYEPGDPTKPQLIANGITWPGNTMRMGDFVSSEPPQKHVYTGNFGASWLDGTGGSWVETIRRGNAIQVRLQLLIIASHALTVGDSLGENLLPTWAAPYDNAEVRVDVLGAVDTNAGAYSTARAEVNLRIFSGWNGLTLRGQGTLSASTNVFALMTYLI